VQKWFFFKQQIIAGPVGFEPKRGRNLTLKR